MGFPALDIALTKNPLALVITPSRSLEVRKIKLISSKFFLMKPWGIFEMDPTKALRYERNQVYLYDVRNAKPFDFLYLRELEEFAKKNKLHRIKRKDLRQASTLRKLTAKGGDNHKALEEVRASEEEAKEQIHKTVEEVNKKIEKIAEQEGQETSQIQIEPIEYSSMVIDELVQKKLIERHEAVTLKMQMIKGEISIEEFVRKLEEVKMVQINTPISEELEKIIEDFHTYEPSIVDAFIDRGEKIGEKIKKMGTPVVKNFMPIMYIFLLIIGAIIAGVAFSNMDFSNVGQWNPFK